MTLALLTVEDPDTQYNFGRIATAFPGNPQIVSGGRTNIATSESTTSTSYTTLTTPDLVTVDLPTDGLIALWYQALWQNTVASNAKAAIFIGSNQIKVGPGAGGAPIVAECPGPAATNLDAYLTTSFVGNNGLASTNGAAGTAENTTGFLIAAGNSNGGGAAFISAAAGTYDISIKFKNSAAGTLTVQKRHLWVAAIAFAS